MSPASCQSRLFALGLALVLLTGASPRSIAAAEPAPATQKGKPAPVALPVSGMRGVADDHGRVSGLALTVENAGWPSLTMLGHPFSIFGALGKSSDHPYDGLGPIPMPLGAVRMGAGGHLTDQQVNEVTNTLTFLNDHDEALRVTMTRLSPAILLDAGGAELELFAEATHPPATTKPGATPAQWDEHRQTMVPIPADQRGPFAPGRFPPSAGLVKPLRWAIPRADGTVLSGVLGSQPSLAFPFVDWHKRFTPIASLAPEKNSAPAVEGLGQRWLLLWYGAGSPFLSSKVPAVISGGHHFQIFWPWALGTVFHADVPLLLVFEKSPQSIELRQEGDAQRLVVSFTGSAGKTVLLPLFGHDIQPAEATEKWLKEFPADVQSRCDAWAKRLGDFPVNVKEETAYDEKADQVTLAETFEYTHVRDGGEKLALVRPMLGLALQQKFPAAVRPQPTDLKYATQFGPLLAVPGDHYEWRLDGLGKYVNGQQIIGPPNPKSAELEKELAAEVDKVLAAGHLAPWVTGAGGLFAGDRKYVCGTDPSEMVYTLAEALPLLSEARQTQVRDYLAREAATYPLDRKLRLKVEEGTRREYHLLPVRYLKDFNSDRTAEYYEVAPSLFRAYVVSRYYRLTNAAPSKESLAFWRQRMLDSLADRQWDTLGWFRGKYAPNRSESPNALRTAHRDMAGLIGYLRLCQLSGEKGEPEAWGQLARLLTLRCSLARYGRYLCESGLFRMPGTPEAAPYSSVEMLVSSPNRVSDHSDPGKELARSADFSRPENHFEQVAEVDQHEVTMLMGASKEQPGWYFGFNNLCGCYQNTFLDLTPEVGRLLADLGMRDDAARYLKHYAELQSVWYKAHAENLQFCTGEQEGIMPNDAYQLFLAHAWIAGTPPETLERYIDEPWVAIGDCYYMHKLAEAIKAYRGMRWEGPKK